MSDKAQFTTQREIKIAAPRSAVWKIMTTPQDVKVWFFGTSVETAWKANAPIVFKGEWQGKPYEDKGTITQIRDGEILEYTHSSSRSPKQEGQADELITFKLLDAENGTLLKVHEQNLPTAEAGDMSKKLWQQILGNLKKLAEQGQ